MGVIIGMDPLKRSATANWLVKDPVTGEPTEDWGHEHHVWHVDTVKALVANQDAEATFFCGGSGNFAKFIYLFDRVLSLKSTLRL